MRGRPPTTASVDAAAVRGWVEDSGLVCRGQELFGWDMEELLTDCFSVLVKPASWRAKRCRVVCNWTFPDEARRLGQLAEIYGAHGHAR